MPCDEGKKSLWFGLNCKGPQSRCEYCGQRLCSYHLLTNTQGVKGGHSNCEGPQCQTSTIYKHMCSGALAKCQVCGYLFCKYHAQPVKDAVKDLVGGHVCSISHGASVANIVQGASPASLRPAEGCLCSVGCGRVAASGFPTCCQPCSQGGGSVHSAACDESNERTAAFQRSCSRLSHVGQAAASALWTKHRGLRGHCWNLSHGRIVGSLAQTPPAQYWGAAECTPTNDHSNYLLEKMSSVLVKAQEWVDIATLSPPDGRFEEMFRAAIREIARKASAQRKKVTIRVLFGHIVFMPVDCEAVLHSLCPPEDSGIELWVGAYRKGVSWNHAKIIAVDGKHLFTGGHNVWDDHYLKSNPVHDVSVEVEGQAADDGHIFANELWSFIAETHQNPPAMAVKRRVSICHWPSSASAYPPMYATRWPQALALAQATMPGHVPMISCGRYGELHRDVHVANPSDSAIVAMLSSAKRVVRMALQDLGPLLLPLPGAAKVPIPGGVWPDAYLSALASGLCERGVQIEIVLSNPNSVPGHLNPMTANYGNGWSCNEVASELVKAVVKRAPHLQHCKLHQVVQENLRVTFVRSCKSCNTWPDGAHIGNHAKFFIVDDTAYYIGSQNLYIADLAEWGVIVDDRAQVEEALRDYWQPMWEESYVPSDCNVQDVLDGLAIDRCGRDASTLSAEDRCLSLQAQRRSLVNRTGSGLDLDEVRQLTELDHRVEQV